MNKEYQLNQKIRENKSDFLNKMLNNNEYKEI